MEIIIILVVMVLFMLFTSTRTAKKAQAKREQMMNQDLVPGAWVMTQSGYYGRYVETDGEVVVLENTQGHESLWSLRAIAAVQEPPFAPDEKEDSSAEETGTADPVSEVAEESVSDTDQKAAAEIEETMVVDIKPEKSDKED